MNRSMELREKTIEGKQSEQKTDNEERAEALVACPAIASYWKGDATHKSQDARPSPYPAPVRIPVRSFPWRCATILEVN